MGHNVISMLLKCVDVVDNCSLSSCFILIATHDMRQTHINQRKRLSNINQLIDGGGPQCDLHVAYNVRLTKAFCHVRRFLLGLLRAQVFFCTFRQWQRPYHMIDVYKKYV